MRQPDTSVASDYPGFPVTPTRATLARIRASIEQVNKELWLILSLFIIALLLNRMFASNRMILAFYTFPTILSAYLYGRRHATLTAVSSILLVIWLVGTPLPLLGGGAVYGTSSGDWLDLIVWGGTLIATAYVMGTLYEHKDRQLKEIRETYHGILLILRQFIAKDQYTENHSYRVSVYAVQIAAAMGLDTERIEDVRAAALLHDIGKLDISRSILYKAARLTEEEFEEMQSHVQKGIAMLEPVGGTLRRVLPIILAHHDKFDGSGYNPTQGRSIPLEARIISVADVYDSLTSDRPYRHAMSPYDAKEIICKGAGTEFDPQVVDAFAVAFRRGGLEVPSLVV